MHYENRFHHGLSKDASLWIIKRCLVLDYQKIEENKQRIHYQGFRNVHGYQNDFLGLSKSKNINIDPIQNLYFL